MRFQARKFTCGPASITNALEVYGEYFQEETIAEWAKTTPQGTSASGIEKAILQAGYTPQKFQHRDATVARQDLETCVTLGVPVILCVDSWEHWVALVGRMNGRAVVADSASNHLILFPEWPDLITRWKYKGSRYSGIRIQKEQLIQANL